jgi:integrase
MPHFKKNPSSGTWYVRFDVDVPGERARRQVHLSASTRKELEKAVALYIAGVEHSGFTESKKTLFSEVCDRWLDSKKNLAFRTVDSYASTIRLYLLPQFGNRRIAAITSADVQVACDLWVTSPTFDDKGAVRSNTTTRYTLTVLGMIFKWARAMRLVRENPVLDIIRPRLVKPPKAASSPEAAALAILSMSRSLLRVAIFVAFVCGLRRGEIIGLRRSDVNLKRKELYIRQTIVCRGSTVRVKKPKTRESTRTIFLDDVTFQWVMDQLDEQEARLERIGLSIEAETPLFDCGDGTAWHPDSFSAAYRRFLGEAGLPHVKLNGTRHSFASMAADAGIGSSVVQHALGHESERTTKDWYTSVSGSSMRKAHGTVSTVISEQMSTIDKRARPTNDL